VRAAAQRRLIRAKDDATCVVEQHDEIGAESFRACRELIGETRVINTCRWRWFRGRLRCNNRRAGSCRNSGRAGMHRVLDERDECRIVAEQLGRACQTIEALMFEIAKEFRGAGDRCVDRPSRDFVRALDRDADRDSGDDQDEQRGQAEQLPHQRELRPLHCVRLSFRSVGERAGCDGVDRLCHGFSSPLCAAPRTACPLC